MSRGALRIALVGGGNMGRALAEEARVEGHRIVARLGRDGDPAEARGADVALEFTSAASAPELVRRLLDAGTPTVSGTTGWDPATAAAHADATGTPLLVAPNFSVGAALLLALAREAAARLRQLPEFEPGILERHHARKLDAPSGTARRLAAAIAEVRGVAPPVAVLRQGGQPGEHAVLFEGAEESLELVHRVRSRRVFARGALHAAAWLVAVRPPGFVTFEQFLESRSQT
ncbi:MAG: 4-hydroxy-tetrahydrodipicolinate reductase [Acidobacteriota bacterium]